MTICFKTSLNSCDSDCLCCYHFNTSGFRKKKKKKSLNNFLLFKKNKSQVSWTVCPQRLLHLLLIPSSSCPSDARSLLIDKGAVTRPISNGKTLRKHLQVPVLEKFPTGWILWNYWLIPKKRTLRDTFTGWTPNSRFLNLKCAQSLFNQPKVLLISAVGFEPTDWTSKKKIPLMLVCFCFQRKLHMMVFPSLSNIHCDYTVYRFHGGLGGSAAQHFSCDVWQNMKEVLMGVGFPKGQTFRHLISFFFFWNHLPLPWMRQLESTSNFTLIDDPSSFECQKFSRPNDSQLDTPTVSELFSQRCR